MKSIPEINRAKSDEALANMPSAIRMMFTASETKEQQDHRERVNQRWIRYSAWLHEYRTANGNEPPKSEYEAKYAEISKALSL